MSEPSKERAVWIADLLRRFEAPLLRHAGAVLGDPAAAQDVVQESFLKLLANGHQPIENVSAWLHRVTHNLAIDHLRHESRLRSLHDAAGATRGPVPAADRELERRQSADQLQRELRHLTPNERAVLFLKVKEGRSYREIAALTGLSATNVGYLLHQGLKKLKVRLCQETLLRKVAP